jgi:hypothetical protein
MQEEGLGFRFYARLAGIGIVVAIVGLILMLIFSRALYAWGFFGMFLLLAVVLFVIGWVIDRREARAQKISGV